MMMSPLYRRFANAPKPLFEIDLDSGTYTDSEILRWSANHGSGGPEAGYDPATAEATLRGLVRASLDTKAEFRLTEPFWNWIKDQCGDWPHRVRFSGRAGKVSVADRGSTLSVPYTTQFTASSWASLLRPAQRQIAPPAQVAINSYLAAAFAHPDLADKIPVIPGAAASFDLISNPTAELQTFSQIMDEYGRDRGILAVQRKDGTVALRSLATRNEMLKTLNQTQPSILRSQALAPGEWTQPIADRGNRFLIRIRQSEGSEVESINWPSYATRSLVQLDLKIIDWDDTVARTENWRHYMDALARRTNYPRTNVTTIVVDIGHLLTSPVSYDKDVALHLLQLEHGDPVFIGGDWSASVRSPMIVTEIKESVTPENWRITLSLDTPRNVIGTKDENLPDVPARVWNQADLQWEADERQWNEA